jgi:unsaturated rhamnogalacturonyl hydrolase
VNINYFCGSWSFGLLYPEIEKYFPEVQLQLRGTGEEIYDFIIHKALRNGDAVILHNIDLPNIYIDTVYYSSVVLAKLGTYLKRDWKKEAIAQLQKHLAILKDGDKPFYIHCEENLGSKRSEGSWARGNGWIMMTCAELLPLLKPNSKEFTLICEEIFLPLAAALETVQTKSGLWRTILDDSSAYEETSASAMYAFSLMRGRKLGILSKHFDKVIDNASIALSKHVDKEGKFIGVSEGTWPGTVKYYKSLDRGEWWWGTGPYLLAMTESH